MGSSKDPKFDKEMEKLADDEFSIRKEITSMKDELKGVEEGLKAQAKAETTANVSGESKVKATRRKVNFVHAAKEVRKAKTDLARVEKELTGINKKLSQELSSKATGYRERIMDLYKRERELIEEVDDIKNSIVSLQNAKKTLFR
jgi:chromosome segregation ATPase